ncbi:MAG TPA: 2-dehydropantoate 2-reductase N-terminal domain-containing protein [Anaerolineaceae bacterium]|nr:2-dehydropantoate 2-reductase N-terminal domain-containing protein [Anaerolineaceae bacterium]HPN51906.1 2-dehydropantoate 2-reductase N-terminal domain-containing protein [Anaerolineaceae bacterium]
MKICVYGAGVLGSLYAAKLQQAGHDVSIVARGKRYEALCRDGIVLINEATGERSETAVTVLDALPPEAVFDVILVLVRKNQVHAVLPVLAANRGTPSIVFMINNAAGPAEYIQAVGYSRVVLGFPGAGGAREGDVIHYQLAGEAQPTTLGEVHGRITPRLEAIGLALAGAGLPVAYQTQMDAWLKTHVALVSPVANALYLAGGDNTRLANTRDGLLLMVRAIREGFQVLDRLSIPVTPLRYRVLLALPEPLLVFVLHHALKRESARLMLARHANAARDEMRQIADEFRILARRSGLQTPALDALYAYLNPEEPPMLEGSRTLPFDPRQTLGMLGVTLGVSLTTLMVLHFWRKK